MKVLVGGHTVSSAELKVLKRLFTAEICDRLPAQFYSKHLSKLEELGLAMPLERRLGEHYPVVIRGWALTEAGRYLYCQSCR